MSPALGLHIKQHFYDQASTCISSMARNKKRVTDQPEPGAISKRSLQKRVKAFNMNELPKAERHDSVIEPTESPKFTDSFQWPNRQQDWCFWNHIPNFFGRFAYTSWNERLRVLLLILLVYGAWHYMFEYILKASSVSAACTPVTTTLWIPYTQIETVTSVTTAAPSELSSLTAAGIGSSSISFATMATFTTTIAHTTTVIVTPPHSDTATVLPSSSPSYLFYVTSGSTVWLNGVSPTVGSPLIIATTSITVVPFASSLSEPTTHTTHTTTSHVIALTTITMPEYTSTVFSMVSEPLTTTITSTRYSTVQLSRVSSSQHLSFTGVNSAGWNSSNTEPSSSVSKTAALVTTFMEFVYFKNSGSTVSTTTALMTATIGDTVTQTFSPALPSKTQDVGPSIFLSSAEVEPVTTTLTIGAPISRPSAFPTPKNTVAVGSSLASSTSPASSVHGSARDQSSSASQLETAPAASMITTTITVNSQTLISYSPSTTSIYGMPSNDKNTNTAHATSASSNSLSITYFIVTSFLSGSGITLTVTSTASATTPRITVVNGSTFPIPVSSNTAPPSMANSTSRLSDPSMTTVTVSGLSQGRGSVLSSGTTEISFLPSFSGIRSPAVSSYTSATSASTLSASQLTITSLSASVTSSRRPNAAPTLSIPPSRTASRVTSLFTISQPAMPTQTCGEQGNFTMDFDTLPTYHSGSARLFKRQSRDWNSTRNGTDITQQPPLSQWPYKHMLFSGGYVYAPSSVEPFQPASAPNVAVFLAEGAGLKPGQITNGEEPGEIGDGRYHDGDPAFFFDAYNAAVGCDNASDQPCTMEITGFVWDTSTRNDVASHVQNYSLPPCPGYKNCQLTHVDFPPTFKRLSGIKMRAVRGRETRMFFVDDLKMRWADDSCSAGLQRQHSPSN